MSPCHYLAPRDTTTRGRPYADKTHEGLDESENRVYADAALSPMLHDADLYDLTALWLEGADQPGWAILLSEMTLGALAPGSEEPVALDLLERPRAEA